MIRGTLGFGVCTSLGASLTFDLPLNTGNPGFGPGFWDDIVSGPGGPGSGNAVNKWQTLGDHMATRIFDAQSQWAIGMNIMPFNEFDSSSIVWAQDKFLQLANASGTNVLALEIQTDGTIAVISGGDGTSGTGTLEKKTTTVFTVEQWSGYLELLAVGLGGSTAVELWLNDVRILSATFTTSAAPDRVLVGSQNGTSGGGNSVSGFGMTYANIYLADGQGPAPWNTRLGPVRITSLSPSADAGGNWNISPNTILNRFEAVADLFPSDRDGSPDFDASTINPISLTDNNQWFTFTKAPCFGLILGVMVNLVFRGSSGSTTCNALLLQQSGQVTIGTVTVTAALGIYQNKQLFQGLTLSGANFTDADLAGSLWGVSTSSPGLILTQMYLEKIVSLRGTPFNCGQSSYSF